MCAGYSPQGLFSDQTIKAVQRLFSSSLLGLICGVVFAVLIVMLSLRSMRPCTTRFWMNDARPLMLNLALVMLQIVRLAFVPGVKPPVGGHFLNVVVMPEVRRVQRVQWSRKRMRVGRKNPFPVADWMLLFCQRGIRSR